MTAHPDSSPPGGFDVERLLSQARAYLAFGDQLQPLFARIPASASEGDWSEVLRQQFDSIKTALTEVANEPGSHPDLARLWTVTLESWRQTAASLGTPATVTLPAGANTADWEAYQRVQGQYLDCLRQAAKAALDLMEHRLSERAQAGVAMASLHAWYTLWVECNEETYGQMLRGAEYGQISGHLLNALLRCYSAGSVGSAPS
jgi:Poly(R)-hydroxyalkanoic acid synthase subunit (PHA_synth_III_E)